MDTETQRQGWLPAIIKLAENEGTLFGSAKVSPRKAALFASSLPTHLITYLIQFAGQRDGLPGLYLHAACEGFYVRVTLVFGNLEASIVPLRHVQRIQVTAGEEDSMSAVLVTQTDNYTISFSSEHSVKAFTQLVRALNAQVGVRK
jgi:hypothetical protein